MPSAPTHTPGRLRSAWALVKSGRVERQGDTQFRVAGNTEPSYNVDLMGDQRCYCADSYFHGPDHQCKHQLAARLAMHDQALLLVLIEMMEFKDDE